MKCNQVFAPFFFFFTIKPNLISENVKMDDIFGILNKQRNN